MAIQIDGQGNKLWGALQRGKFMTGMHIWQKHMYRPCTHGRQALWVEPAAIVRVGDPRQLTLNQHLRLPAGSLSLSQLVSGCLSAPLSASQPSQARAKASAALRSYVDPHELLGQYNPELALSRQALLD